MDAEHVHTGIGAQQFVTSAIASGISVTNRRYSYHNPEKNVEQFIFN